MDEEKHTYLKLNNISPLINSDKELNRLKEELERVKEELKTKTEECHQYENDMVNISVMDRWNIGKFLHDNLSQKLIYAKILVSLLKEKLLSYEVNVNSELNEIMWVIEDGAREIRSLSHDIIPMDVKEEGLFEAFKYLKSQTKKRHGVNCTLAADDIIQKINNLKIATNLYHIAQEAIKNAVVHGEAKNVEITLLESDRHLHLQVKDDGKGLASTSGKEGMGITIMKHRAKEIGGYFGINTAAEDESFSTCVTCIIPLEIITKE